MDVEPQSARKRASREATQWAILLREEPDDRDLRRRFEAWRRESPLHEAAWTATQRASNLAANALPAYRDEWEALVAKKDAAARRHRPSTRRWAVPVMAVAIAACIAVVFAPTVLLQLLADHTTGTAELRELPLEDGSQVTLAPGSAIVVAYGGGERRVHLLQGEAFFKVKPDASKPFRVAARSVQATVLGTSFDVRLDDSGVIVAVEEGTVRVDANAAAETLQAGQSLRIDRGGQAHRDGEPPQLVTAWRHGQLYLQNRPLGDAVDQLRRYYVGTIIVADPSLADRPTTGVFNLGDPEAALRGIAEAHGATVRRITPWILVLSRS